jgi:hypothetical protein
MDFASPAINPISQPAPDFIKCDFWIVGNWKGTGHETTREERKIPGWIYPYRAFL